MGKLNLIAFFDIIFGNDVFIECLSVTRKVEGLVELNLISLSVPLEFENKN